MNRIINYLVDAIGGVLFYFGQTKLRTALTLMGITVGVSSIIAIMTVLETFEQSTESLVADMKTNIFYITKDNPVQVHLVMMQDGVKEKYQELHGMNMSN